MQIPLEEGAEAKGSFEHSRFVGSPKEGNKRVCKYERSRPWVGYSAIIYPRDTGIRS